MSVETWFAFVVAAAALLVIPGPTILTVISYSVAHGVKRGRASDSARQVSSRGTVQTRFCVFPSGRLVYNANHCLAKGGCQHSAVGVQQEREETTCLTGAFL